MLETYKISAYNRGCSKYSPGFIDGTKKDVSVKTGAVTKCKNFVTAPDEKAWIFDDSDYIVESENFGYKSRLVTKEVMEANGKKQTITEKVVVYWDKHFYDHQLKENKFASSRI